MSFPVRFYDSCKYFQLVILCFFFTFFFSFNQVAVVSAVPVGKYNEYWFGRFAEAEIIIKAMSDINYIDEDGNTVLILAIKYNSDYNQLEQLVEPLLKLGANVNAKNKHGLTPLMTEAFYNKSYNILSLLLKAGADVNVKNISGYTSLMFLVDDSRIYDSADPNLGLKSVEMFIKAGADVNAKTSDGETPLMIAVTYHNNPEVVALLVKSGAEINSQDNNGNTAFMLAASRNKNHEIVKLLLNSGADIYFRNNDGRTPIIEAVLHLGAERDVEAIERINILFNAGVNINASDINKKTALAYAKEIGYSELVVTLLGFGAK
ncbi:ankyrin repeat domain-containing protein [Desulfovibrio litoralis]|uniref:Ankyrin repeat-containing protein n=1 Tax=Desulfovibrio litoralis DSM 11393 TaxID=1121455 RepID=A0A1M7SP29_9BACT|nr:ankyrin repeat domain-containing protein [Desulfovibrio litoralis]SHN60184.1 Ankyrin repeat-containing protein [Desulfovibrio litoralis DSM 11393]